MIMLMIEQLLHPLFKWHFQELFIYLKLHMNIEMIPE